MTSPNLSAYFQHHNAVHQINLRNLRIKFIKHSLRKFPRLQQGIHLRIVLTAGTHPLCRPNSERIIFSQLNRVPLGKFNRALPLGSHTFWPFPSNPAGIIFTPLNCVARFGFGSFNWGYSSLPHEIHGHDERSLPRRSGRSYWGGFHRGTHPNHPIVDFLLP